MSLFRWCLVFGLILLVPLCRGVGWVYNAWRSPSYKALAWSPDGSAVVCDYGIDDYDGTVVVVPKNGGSETLLHDNYGGFQACYWASFSPDGQKVAFGHLGLYVINADGTHKQRLADATFLGWSPESPWMVLEQDGKKFELNPQTNQRRTFTGKLAPDAPTLHGKSEACPGAWFLTL
jgi:Tol biopolymer transport system component